MIDKADLRRQKNVAFQNLERQTLACLRWQTKHSPRQLPPAMGAMLAELRVNYHAIIARLEAMQSKGKFVLLSSLQSVGGPQTKPVGAGLPWRW